MSFEDAIECQALVLMGTLIPMPHNRLSRELDEKRAGAGSPVRRALFISGLVAISLVTSGALNRTWAGSPKAGAAVEPSFPPRAIEFFETRIRPILADHCLKCHGPKKQSGGLRLDSREAVLAGGDSGPAVVAANPEKSLLVRAVAQTHEELKMPPAGKLAEPSIAMIRQWVAEGAPWPLKTAAAAGSGGHGRASAHWSLQPIRKPPAPAVRNVGWAISPVDAFVLARLEGAGPHAVAAGGPPNLDPSCHLRPLGNAADRRGGRGVRRPTRRPTRFRVWSIVSLRLHAMASDGAGTGWTWLATPTPRGTSSRKTGAILMPTPTATTWSARSMPTCGYDRFLL